MDAYGNVATGIDHRLPNADAAIALPWRHRGTGVAATPSEIRAAFEQIREQGPGHKTIAYRFASDLVLAAGVAVDLAATRIERDFLPGLRRLCPNFDRYPLPARRALVDMAYDLGLGGLAKFRNLMAACKRGDFATAAEHCHRRTTRGIRNARDEKPVPRGRGPDRLRSSAGNAIGIVDNNGSQALRFVGKNAPFDGG